MDVATCSDNSMCAVRPTSCSCRDEAGRVGRLAGLMSPRLRGPSAAVPAAVAAGAVFVSFGIGHFANHASEVADFRRYEVPVASVAVWAVGVAELVGGLALLLGLVVRLAATVLAADMVGVVATAGRVQGGSLNLGLAPVLFAAMAFLVWAGPGPLALDRVIAGRR
jgi:putative oxidoreductase